MCIRDRVQSQFDALEEPSGEPDVVTLPADVDLDTVVAKTVQGLAAT